MIAGLLPTLRASLPLVYLGVPIFLGSSRHTHFNQLLDSIRYRLGGWKMKCLSFVGWLILVKHVLSSIPLHISLALPTPCKTSLQIERVMRNFLWSASLEKQRSNLVNWELVCLPKTQGGLGLRRVKEFNEACLLQLGWSKHHQTPSGLACFVKGTLGPHPFGILGTQRLAPASGRGSGHWLSISNEVALDSWEWALYPIMV